MRRKFVRGLADANVTAQKAQKLAGHADLAARALPTLVPWRVDDTDKALPAIKVERLSTELVRHARFERATFGSGGQRSIQLS